MSYCGKCGNVLEEEGHQCRIKDDPTLQPTESLPPESIKISQIIRLNVTIPVLSRNLLQHFYNFSYLGSYHLQDPSVQSERLCTPGYRSRWSP